MECEKKFDGIFYSVGMPETGKRLKQTSIGETETGTRGKQTSIGETTYMLRLIIFLNLFGLYMVTKSS